MVMATKKKGKTSSKKGSATSKREVSSGKRQIRAVILFAVAVFMLCVVFIKGESVWTYMHNFLFGVFGITAYFYPILLGFIAVLIAMERCKSAVGAKVAESAVFVVLLSSCIDIFAVYEKGVKFGSHLKAAYIDGASLKSGGFFGALIGHPLCEGFGKTGAAITVILLMFVFLMIITGTTLIKLFRGLSKPVKKITEQAEEAYENNTEESGNLKVIKGFNVDIPVDDIPEKRTKNIKSPEEQMKKVVSTYRDEEPVSHESVENSNTKPEENTPEVPEGSEDNVKMKRNLPRI